MLCYDGQVRNGSVATHFLHFSSTVTSNARSEYLSVLERPGRIEEKLVEMRNRLVSFHLDPTLFYLKTLSVIYYAFSPYLNRKY